jgi:type IV pilus assembly protein PilY1
MRSNADRLPHWLRVLVLAQVIAIYLAAMFAPVVASAAAVTPPASLAQVPQFLQFPPAPNVFITIDNSGSMVAEILPDDDTVPQRMFPEKVRAPYDSGGNAGATNNLTNIRTLAFVGFCHTLNVARLRSSSNNLIYYNPRIRYRPWKTADSLGTITSYPQAGAVALYNPVFPAIGGLDLTSDNISLGNYDVLEDRLNSNTGTYVVNTKCSDGNDGEGSSGDWNSTFALYYNYDPTRSGCSASSPTTDLNCYQRVEVMPGRAPFTIPAGNQRGQSDEPGCTTSAGVTQCTYAAEFQNFANWFQYYRSRTLLARGAMSNAVADLGAGFRIGLGILNTTANSRGAPDGFVLPDGSNSVTVRLGVRDFTGANRKPWFDLLQNHDVGSNTPSGRALMEVGDYFDWKNATTGAPAPTGPWSDDPAAGSTQFASCRQSYHVYSTDGYWNENAGALFGGGGIAAAALNADNTNGPTICRPPGDPGLPQCYTYVAGSAGATTGPPFDNFGAPLPNSLGNANNLRFTSAESRSLADIAMYFWYRDLQPNIANNVTPSSADPAFWQHLSTIAVALGFTGTVTGQGDTYLQALDNGTATWPTGLNPNGADPKTADDLWHAAVNSRGRLFVAGNPQELSAQLSAALNEIRARAAVGSAAASSTAFLDTGNGIFTAEISQGTWSGNLYRREIDPTTLNWRATDAAGVALPRDANNVPYLWRASDQLGLPASRKIFTMRTGSNPRDALVAFLPNSGTTGVDAAQMADLQSPGGAQSTDVINYLRGDRTKELSAVPAGTLRDRPRQQAGVPGSLNNVIGTIANSAPIFVRDDDFNYDFLPTTAPGQSTYLAYLRANQGTAATPGRAATVWTGSNEGMFHAFDATTGAELFAYVPRAAIPNLSLLADSNYQHRFMVDGVPSAGDAFIGPPGGGTAGWRTVVVSSLGAGGRAVFAVNATDPTALDASSVYWELGQQSLTASDFALLGSTLGAAFIARVKDAGATGGGRWVAVFGNGPESDSKRAALWVVDLQNGQPIRILDTGNGDVTNPNGLSTPAPLFDTNRQLVAVYAGDLRGNVWKFDLSGAIPSSWNVAFSTSPLFTTQSPATVGPAATRSVGQPIFAKPLLRRHPDGGVMVLFGTGKLISPGDRESEDVQTFYGVWDKPNETGGLAADFRTTGTLVQQAITSVSGTPSTYFMTNYDVNYGAGKRGWFFDLGVTYNASGASVDTGSGTQVTPRERMVASPIALGQNMLAQSFVPSVDSCDLAGLSYLFRLKFLTGGFMGVGSFGSPQSGAIAMPGSFGLLPFLDRLAAGQDPSTRTGVIFGIGVQGDLSGRRIDLGGLGAFRTWRQLLD